MHWLMVSNILTKVFVHTNSRKTLIYYFVNVICTVVYANLCHCIWTNSFVIHWFVVCVEWYHDNFVSSYDSFVSKLFFFTFFSLFFLFIFCFFCSLFVLISTSIKGIYIVATLSFFSLMERCKVRVS